MDEKREQLDWVAAAEVEGEKPPEVPPHGPVVWARENLFSSVGSGILTVAGLIVALGFFKGMLGYIFGADRKWDAVATNLRLYFTQAYPEDQYVRVWVAVGVAMALAGLSAAIWRANGRITGYKLGGGSFGLAGGLLTLLLLSPFSWRARLIYLLVALVFIGIGQYLRSVRPKLEVPALGVIVGTLAVLVGSLWVVPYGKHTFVDGQVQPPRPGTVAMTTKLPWTVMLLVMIVAYFVGKAVRDKVSPGLAKGLLSAGWMLLLPIDYFVILRDPALDYGQVFRVDVPIFLAFAVAGSAILWWLSSPHRGEIGRVVAGAMVIGAGVFWLAAAFGLSVRQIVRIDLVMLAVVALAAPTFAGEKAIRRKFIIGWVVILALVNYLAMMVNTPSTVDVPGSFPLGGFSLTLLVASATLMMSFPIGLILALGRTSKMPIFRLLSTTYIEVIRGVPLITILIFFKIILNLFLPDGMVLGNEMAAILGYSLFSAAYLAENVRGGLQSIRKGQYEAAAALGMSTPQTTSFIVLPQALRAVVPPLVSGVIATFKETSLLFIIGLFDFLRIGYVVVGGQTAFVGSQRENLLFVAFIYWIITFSISRSSVQLEKKLGLGER
ncbi:MAG TPA: amino acid ABC transporter permease [Acidimicrobiales bacterium]|nr:amino acid ABC transporter permease [Acidimicrobiales bacterium]